MSQVDELLAIHHYLQSVPTTQITNNILRASLTMLVSTIDTTIHELLINAIMCELKERKSIFSIEKIQIDIISHKESDPEARLRIINACLRQRYAKESFQSSRQIENALSTIGITKIWTKLSVQICMPPEDIKRKLDLLVRRRNQIVHEGDLDHLHSLRDIERNDLDEARVFAKELVYGIINEYTHKLEMV